MYGMSMEDNILKNLSLSNGGDQPLHRQLSSFLVEAIRSGQVPEGDMLPSEHTMCRELGISRVTVRRAVDDLVEQGFVARQAGRGMVVLGREPQPEKSKRVAEVAAQPSRLISLIVANALGSFMSLVIQGVDEILREHGYRVTISVSDDDFDREREAIRSAVEQGVDGILLFSVGPRDGVNPNCYEYLRVQEQGLPLLLLDRYFPDLPLGYVVGDNRRNMRELTEQLLDHGHTQIGLLYSDLSITSVRDRYQGFVDAMMVCQHKPAAIIEAGGRHTGLDDVQLGIAAIERFLESGESLPHAIVATSSYLGIGAQRVLRAAGYEVPDDVAIIGYEDVPEAAALDVPLTVFDVPVAELGRVAAQRMIDVIEKRIKAYDVRVELPGRLIARSSCGTVPEIDNDLEATPSS